MTEPMGSEVIVDLKVGDKIVKVKAPPDIEIKIGDKSWTGFKEDKIHIFS